MKTNDSTGGTVKSWLHWFSIACLSVALVLIIIYGPEAAELYFAPKTSQDQNEEPEIPTRALKPTEITDETDEAEDTETLQSLIDTFAAEQPADFNIYVKNLKTGETAQINPHEPVPSGSIYKMYLADYVYKQNEAGKLSMGAAAGHGGNTLQSCTMLMVRDSNNDCGEAVRATLGPENINRHLKQAGYDNTDVSKSPAAVTSAYDLGQVFLRLYEGGYFSDAHTAEFMGYLKDQMWTFRIPEGIPREPAGKGLTGTRNKTGDVYGYANDGAIVLGENTDYVLIVMSSDWPRIFPDSSIAIRHLSGLVYNYMNDTDYELIY